MAKKNILEKTAETILETPLKITIGGKEFEVAHPTCATLIEFSKRSTLVPYIDRTGAKVTEVIAMAKDSRPMIEQMAVLIVGAKEMLNGPKKGLFGRKEKSRFDEVVDHLLYNCSPSELNKARAELLDMMEIEDFFEFSAFLQEVNLIQVTREAETIQYGQS